MVFQASPAAADNQHVDCDLSPVARRGGVHCDAVCGSQCRRDLYVEAGEGGFHARAHLCAIHKYAALAADAHAAEGTTAGSCARRAKGSHASGQQCRRE